MMSILTRSVSVVQFRRIRRRTGNLVAASEYSEYNASSVTISPTIKNTHSLVQRNETYA